MPNRNKRAKDKDRFIFTTDLRLIKPFVEYHMCIENYFSRFKPNDVILYNKNIGFALIIYRDYCPIDIVNDNLRSKLNRQQPAINTQMSHNQIL